MESEDKMDGVQIVMEALKVFETVKPGIEGVIASGTLLSATTKGSVYVIKKGAQFISYLIKSGKKKPAARLKAVKSGGTKKSFATTQDDIQITKPDVAIVIDISRRALVEVARFLESKKIDADIVLVTNDPLYEAQVKFLNPESEDEWNEVTLEFKSLMNKIKRTSGGRRVHIFLSAPAPLVFAMGAVWGTVDEASVYHWEHNTYNKVIAISRKLR